MPSSVHHTAAKEMVMDQQLRFFTTEDMMDLSDWEEMAEQGVACVPPPKVIADFVRWSRQVLQWKKETLASFASVSLSTVERIERGQRASSESLDRVAATLNSQKGRLRSREFRLASVPRWPRSRSTVGGLKGNNRSELGHCGHCHKSQNSSEQTSLSTETGSATIFAGSLPNCANG
jgi:hypothetical protein